MNCIAIDDEPLALDVIKNFCQKIDFINLVTTYTNAFDAITELNKHYIDLLFLDMEMPNITGIEFIKCLPDPPLIIITSAFPGYAANGFELNAVDYLLKPISFDKFFKAVNKASTRLYTKPGVLTSPAQPQEIKPDEYLFIKADYSTVKVSFDKIKYIEGLKDYVKIYLNDKHLITKSTIKHIESRLPDGLFARVHKSYIISIDKIDKIEYNHVYIGSKIIPVGTLYKDSFYRKIDQFRL